MVTSYSQPLWMPPTVAGDMFSSAQSSSFCPPATQEACQHYAPFKPYAIVLPRADQLVAQSIDGRPLAPPVNPFQSAFGTPLPSTPPTAFGSCTWSGLDFQQGLTGLESPPAESMHGFSDSCLDATQSCVDLMSPFSVDSVLSLDPWHNTRNVDHEMGCDLPSDRSSVSRQPSQCPVTSPLASPNPIAALDHHYRSPDGSSSVQATERIPTATRPSTDRQLGQAFQALREKLAKVVPDGTKLTRKRTLEWALDYIQQLKQDLQPTGTGAEQTGPRSCPVSPAPGSGADAHKTNSSSVSSHTFSDRDAQSICHRQSPSDTVRLPRPGSTLAEDTYPAVDDVRPTATKRCSLTSRKSKRERRRKVAESRRRSNKECRAGENTKDVTTRSKSSRVGSPAAASSTTGGDSRETTLLGHYTSSSKSALPTWITTRKVRKNI